MEILEPHILAARFAVERLHSWDLPAIAERLLQRGVYADSLMQLAELSDTTWSDAAPLFIRAMEDIGQPIPSRLAAARTLLRYHAERIVAGAVDLESELGEMYRSLSEDLPRQAPDLLVVAYMCDDLNGVSADQRRTALADLTAQAIAAARRVLAADTA